MIEGPPSQTWIPIRQNVEQSSEDEESTEEKKPSINSIWDADSSASDTELEETEILPRQPPVRWYQRPFSRSTALVNIAQFSFTVGGFGTTLYFGIREGLGDRNVKVLSLCALFNGAVFSSCCDLLIPQKYHKELNRFSSDWAYETVLALSQVNLNAVPPDSMQYSILPFIWMLGMFESKDVLTIKSLKQSDFPFSTPTSPIDESTLLRTLGFTTRDKTVGPKLLLVAMGVTAIALTILNFTIFKEKYESDDFGEVGFYQDLIAMFTGSIAGESVAHLIDDWKEKKEYQHFRQLIGEQLPWTLKFLRFVKNNCLAFTPTMIGGLLGLSNSPNSPSDYCVKAAIGVLYGSQQFLYRREFENPGSHYHVSRIQKDSPTTLVRGVERVKRVVKEYFPSALWFLLLYGYFIFAAFTNPLEVDYAIAVLLGSTSISYLSTTYVSNYYSPKAQNRLGNELIFRMLYFPFFASFVFQYCTTKVEIGDMALREASPAFYAFSLFSWACWGWVVGNNRAVSSDKRMPPRMTPPITNQELAKAFMKQMELQQQ